MSVNWYGVTITVEAALAAPAGSNAAWGTGAWGTSTWGPGVIWEDISAYVRHISTSRGFSRDVAAWEAGTAQVTLDNRDGRFSPSNLSGPYVTAGGRSKVAPWRPIRIRATYNSVTYDLFTGYALRWRNKHDLARSGAGDAEVTIPCVDEFGRLARFNGYEQPTAGAGELTGLRVHRILDNAGHRGPRNVDPGVYTMQGTTLAQNAVGELKLAQDSEGGAVWVDADGTVMFEDQSALIVNTRSNTVQSVWTDTDGAALSYSDVEFDDDGDLLRNIVSYARVGGTAVTVTNPTSRALFGDLAPDTRTDLMCETDEQVEALARWALHQFNMPEERAVGITIPPRGNAAARFPEVFGRRPRDLIQVVRHPPGGDVMTYNCLISRIDHDLDVSGEWSTGWGLWSAEVYQNVGRWGHPAWGTSTFFI